jgi:NAD-dependent dihydropyrimidine dehydrogenase PreA subunit
MSWLVLSGLVLALGLAFLATVSRKNELARMRRGLEQRERNAAAGPDAVLRHPVVDLSRCLGCGTCVASCPEGDVLALVHGQALVVNAARCVGHAACERECPVGAITITVANLAERRDVKRLAKATAPIARLTVSMVEMRRSRTTVRITTRRAYQKNLKSPN